MFATLIGQRLDLKPTASRDKRIRRAEVYTYRKPMFRSCGLTAWLLYLK